VLEAKKLMNRFKGNLRIAASRISILAVKKRSKDWSKTAKWWMRDGQKHDDDGAWRNQIP
jgi:hypothetical protein